MLFIYFVYKEPRLNVVVLSTLVITKYLVGSVTSVGLEFVRVLCVCFATLLNLR